MTPADLRDLTARIAAKRVLCVGDLILDRFVYGAAAGVSREAPVVTMRQDRVETMLGAVGNVARNVASLGGAPIVAAVAGDDADGHEVSKALADADFAGVELITAPGRQTPVKTRFVAGGQQVLCVDRDPRRTIDAATEDQLVAAATSAVTEADVVVLSDYGRGAVTPKLARAVLEAAAQAGVKAVVDPRGRDFSRYDGAFVLKPNAQELALEAGTAVLDDATAATALDAVMAGLSKVDHLLVTRSSKGMSLLRRGGAAEHFRAEPRDVYDVSGAGDTTLAALALAIAADAAIEDAIAFAMRAAGIVVTKVGTAAVRADEVVEDAGGRIAGAAPLDEVRQRAARWRARGLSVGFTNGCFDVLHAGHLATLTFAREHCDRLIVGLNSDASVKRLKGAGRPINSMADRARLLAALAPVDAVVVFEDDTATKVIEAVTPDVYVKGGDYDPETLPETPAVRAGGGRVVIAPLSEGLSTTGTLAKLGGN